MVENLIMDRNDETTADEQLWVKQHIESRVERGKEWHSRLEDHVRLATASRYVRILGRSFRPVSISELNPCGHLRYADSEKKIAKCSSLKLAIERAETATELKPGAGKPEHRVQAFLIRAAIQNGLRFGAILPDFTDVFDELIFITDELAIKPGEVKEECRADIIALGSKRGRFLSNLKINVYSER